MDPEYLIRRSFHQFQHDSQLPQLEKKLKELEEQKKHIIIPDENQVGSMMIYVQVQVQIQVLL